MEQTTKKMKTNLTAMDEFSYFKETLGAMWQAHREVVEATVQQMPDDRQRFLRGLMKV